MKKTVIFVILTLLVSAGMVAGCSSGGNGAGKGLREVESIPPVINLRTMQLAVTGLMLAGGEGQLDGSYDGVDTKEEIQKVTAGNGAHNLSAFLTTNRYPLGQAFDITQDGTVTVD